MAEDHQTKNALAIVNNDAALLLKQSDVSMFNTMFSELLNDEALQKSLGENIKQMALPDATKTIVNEIEKLIF